MPILPSLPHNSSEDNEEFSEYKEEAPALTFAEEQAQVEEAETTEDQLQLPSTSEAELPLEAQGETNGGPLGCCLGITVGIMLSLFFGVIGFGRVSANVLIFLIHADAITNIRIATAFFTIIGAFVGGYFGWKIGKRVYREYELSPRQKQRLEQLERKHRRAVTSK
ncbi:MAG: hypothetical protein NVS4B7_00160 [Ktedonobacteraceae bacterium]